MTKKLNLNARLQITKDGETRLELTHKAFTGYWVGTIVDDDLILTKSQVSEGAHANSSGGGGSPRRYLNLHKATHEIPRATPGKPVCTPVDVEVSREDIHVIGAVSALRALEDKRQEPTETPAAANYLDTIKALLAAANAGNTPRTECFTTPDGTNKARVHCPFCISVVEL